MVCARAVSSYRATRSGRRPRPRPPPPFRSRAGGASARRPRARRCRAATALSSAWCSSRQPLRRVFGRQVRAVQAGDRRAQHGDHLQRLGAARRRVQHLVKRGIGGQPQAGVVLGVELGLQRVRAGAACAACAAGSRGAARRTPAARAGRTPRARRPPSRLATNAPRLGSTTTSPSACSLLSASRTGMRLTPNSAASSSWRSAAPGGQRPWCSAPRSAAATESAVVAPGSHVFKYSCIQKR